MHGQQQLFDDAPPLAADAPTADRIARFAEFRHRAIPFSKRNWGSPLHSLCSYQSKLKPSIAYFLTKCMTSPGDRVLDPFSGVGTVPLEACLQGRIGCGVDINPVAYASTLAKVDFPTAAEELEFVARFADYLQNDLVSDSDLKAVTLRNINGRLQDYFHKKTFAEIVTARKFFENLSAHTPASAFALAALLHILHGNRPYALSRRSHGITPFAPTGPFEYKPLIQHLRKKIDRVSKVSLPETYSRGEASFCSVFEFMPSQPFDAIITSPPFLKSTRFYLANWLRLWFCGWEDNDFSATTRGDFLEEMQAKSMLVYKKVFERFLQFLKPGGLCILHVGVVGGRDMGAELVPFAQDVGFDILELLYEDVVSCEKHGVRDQGSTRKHAYLFLRSPG